MSDFSARPWRITATTLDLGGGGKSKTTKGGDQGILVIDGDRYLILDAHEKMFDQGRFEPRGGRRLRFRNMDGVMDLELEDLTPKGAVLRGTLSTALSEGVSTRFVLAATTKPPAVRSPEDLQQAAKLGDVAAIGRLLAAGKGVNDTKGGATPLMRAAAACHPAAVRKLLDAGADVNAVSGNGKTALILGTECGDLDVVTALLAKKAPVRVPRRQDKATPLVIAVSDGRVDLVRVLLDAGADLRDKDEYGNTLLATATKGVGLANREVPDLVAFLLDKKVDPNERGQYGLTPLMDAAMNNQARVVRLLLDHGANPKLTDEQGRPTTEYAKDNAAILKLLQRP